MEDTWYSSLDRGSKGLMQLSGGQATASSAGLDSDETAVLTEERNTCELVRVDEQVWGEVCL